jgi:hypothetical protein
MYRELKFFLLDRIILKLNLEKEESKENRKIPSISSLKELRILEK